MPTRSRESGFVLLAAMLVLMSTVSLGAIGLSRSIIELNAAQRLIDKQQAFEQAEAAVDDALATLTDNPQLALPFTPTTSVATPTALIPLGTKTYTITSLGNNIVRISATGTSGMSQTVEVIAQMPANKPYQQALFGEDGVHIHNSIVLDSYDSTLGDYNEVLADSTVNRTLDADVRTNSTDVNTVQIDQFADVGGDVLVGVGGVPSAVIQQAGGAVIQGTTSAATTNLTFPAISTPSGTVCGPALVVKAGTPQTIDLSTAPCYSSINVEKDAVLTVTGTGQLTLGSNDAADLVVAGTLAVTGNATVIAHEVSMTSQVTLSSTARLKLYASDSCTVKGIYNANHDPRSFSVLYSGTSTLSAGQNTDFYGVIYAPHAAIDLKQSADFYGAVMGKSIDFDQGGRFHFDTSLVNVSNDGSTVKDFPVVISWRQL